MMNETNEPILTTPPPLKGKSELLRITLIQRRDRYWDVKCETQDSMYQVAAGQTKEEALLAVSKLNIEYATGETEQKEEGAL